MCRSVTKGIALALRSIFGTVVAIAQDIASGRDAERDFPRRTISTAPASDPVTKRGGRLLAAIHELHKAGYQRIRICAGWSANGAEWRCKLVPASKTGPEGWRPYGDGPEYVSTQGKVYFHWHDCDGDDARALAKKILERFPELAKLSVGPDWAYAGWFSEILGRAEHGELPAFYRHGFAVKESPESAPFPPTAPAYARSVRPETGFPLIANEELTLEDLPAPNADEATVAPFCLSYDGYDGFRTIDDCIYIADKIEREGVDNADMDSLRISAFIHQRAIKWTSDFESADPKYLRSIHAIIAEIRRRLGG